MSKATQEGAQFFARAGQFSTHASRRGVNLLGWECPEDMTPEQERAALQARAKQLHALLSDKALPKDQRKALGAELSQIGMRINAIRPKPKNQGVEKYILDILREELTAKQWDILMRRGIARMRAAQAAAIGAHSAT